MERSRVRAPVAGRCDAAFAAVRQAFEANFTEQGEVGAAVCVTVGGTVVVELAGGWADADRRRPWRPDTLVDFYSVGKAFVALLVLQLVDAGRVGLDDRVSTVWPEFAVGGKEAATVRHALCHRAGVPAIREPLTDDDLWHWDRMTGALARTGAWWEPGTRHAYHTNTYGHLSGEIVRRLTGELPGDRLRAVAGALGADVWCGLPPREQARCAEVLWAPRAELLGALGRPGRSPGTGDDAVPTAGDLDTGHDNAATTTAAARGTRTPAADDDAEMVRLGYVNPPGYSSIGVVNTPEWRGAQVPSTNGHGTAAGVARVYAALLEPGRLLSADLLAEATRVQSEGYCPVLGEEVGFGLGFKPTSPRRPFGPNAGSFGHFGTGGAVGFADPAAGVAFGYVMNHVIPRWQSTRNRALIDAVYACL